MQNDITPDDITSADVIPADIQAPSTPMKENAATTRSRPDIVGWGADLAFENRPGYPQEVRPPQPIGNGRPGIPLQQTTGTPSVPSEFRPITRVYGTAIPPRGLSGVIRRYAYSIPDYKASRWATLLFADRVDVLEHNPEKLLLRVGLVAAGIYLALNARPRRSFLQRLFG